VDDQLVCIVVRNESVLDKGFVVGFYGLSNSRFVKLTSLLGVNPIGRLYDKTTPGRQYFYTDTRLRRFEGRIHKLADGQLPNWMTVSIECLFGIKRIFTAALNHQSVPMGTVLIFERRPLHESQLQCIEELIRMASRKLYSIAVQEQMNFYAIPSFDKSLLSRLHHEIRTPLNGIVGLVEAVADQAKPGNDEVVSDIKDCANQLERTVDNLILIANLDARRVVYRFHSIPAVYLKEIMELLVKQFERDFPQRTFRITHQLPHTSFDIRADVTYLNRLFAELLSNAVKFSEHDVAVHLACDDQCLNIQIKDQGVGIAHHERQRIFDTFHRASIEPENHRGTGVGLSIAKHVASDHGFTPSYPRQLSTGNHRRSEDSIKKNGDEQAFPLKQHVNITQSPPKHRHTRAHMGNPPRRGNLDQHFPPALHKPHSSNTKKHPLH
jgi:signal transduction histidine kinase